ncbi:MAG: PRD domain-containing protein [Firmicutes bacterium]|nr:PRD domain-containing protein [Bacillota bacterium]
MEIQQPFELQVIKALNNNVILARERPAGQEMILIGKGLGFLLPRGSKLTLDDARIEKASLIVDSSRREQYQQLLKIVDERIIGVAEEIIEMASERFGCPLSDHIHVALPDHIGFALERLRRGLEIPNPMLNEIRNLYVQEYRLAKEAATLIEQRLDARLPESDVGFLALHLYAARSKRDPKEASRYLGLIREIIGIVEGRYQVVLAEGNLDYERLLIHLKGLFEALETGKKVENPLLDKIQAGFSEAFALAGELAALVKSRTGREVPQEQVGYLALHLERIKNGSVA